MTTGQDFLDRFSCRTTEGPLYVPDLTLWYEWHQTRGTLPEGWRDRTLTEIARLLRVPAWLPAQLWAIETPGIEVKVDETTDKRIITYETSTKPLVARWTLGPDGDWWQTEYPVKSEDHLQAAVELVASRTYIVDASRLAVLQADVGEDGLVALALPKRPYSELLHDLLGWSDGLLLLDEPEIEEMLTLMESKLQDLVEQLAKLPGQMVLSPDNLDGQFISPTAFDTYLTGSYRHSAECLHSHGKQLLVHVGGPVKRLLGPLAASGIDGIQGICGPPQSDASMSETREIVGPKITLWGGIPQDVMLETHEWDQLEAAAAQAAAEVAGDPRMIIGVADRVPVHATPDRLQATVALIEATSRV